MNFFDDDFVPLSANASRSAWFHQAGVLLNFEAGPLEDSILAQALDELSELYETGQFDTREAVQKAIELAGTRDEKTLIGAQDRFESSMKSVIAKMGNPRFD